MQDRALTFVALIGSLRRASSSRAIANTLDELAPDDVQVDLLPSVGGLPHYDEDIERACFPQEVIAMSKAVSEADGVVIVTPEYNHSVPGLLKNALDWLSRVPEQAFAGKPVAIQTTSPGSFGGLRAQDHLRQMLASMDALVLNKPEVSIPYAPDKVDGQTGFLREGETRRAVALQLEALSKLSRALKAASSAAAPTRSVPAS